MKTLFIRRRLRLLFFFAGCLLPGAYAHAQAPGWQGAVAPVGGTSIINSTAVDSAGNVVVCGTFTGTVIFGAATLNSSGPVGANEGFVAKLNRGGVWQWVAPIRWAPLASSGNDEFDVRRVAVDRGGNVYVSGFFLQSSAVTLGPTTLTGSTGRLSNGFVGKLNPTGGWQWAVQAEGTGLNLAVDGSGNAYVAGSFSGDSARFGATTLINPSGHANLYIPLFVARLSAAGAWQWAVVAGGTGGVSNNIAGGLYSGGIALDSSTDEVVVAGYFNNQTATFGSVSITRAGPINTYDIFVARLSSAGIWRAAQAAGGAESEFANGLVVDGRGAVGVTGYFSGPTATFGATTLTGVGTAFSMYAAKLSAAGAWEWAVGVGGAGDNIGSRVVVDSSGAFYLMGRFTATATFGGTTLNALGALDVFVAKLSAVGAWQWAVGAGGSGDDFGRALVLTRTGELVVGGQSDGPAITFGTTTLTNVAPPGEPMGFVARLAAPLGLPVAGAAPTLRLSPNPARESVRLTGAPGIPTVLLDALGRVVRHSSPVTHHASLDLRGLAPGVYTVRVGAVSRRLVVE